MSDTIELLKAIGENAALRYASAEELAQTLEQVDASEAFKAAVMSGDSSPLSVELGQKPMQVPQSSQTGFEDDEPGHHHKDDPHHPAPHEHEKPSPGR